MRDVLKRIMYFTHHGTLPQFMRTFHANLECFKEASMEIVDEKTFFIYVFIHLFHLGSIDIQDIFINFERNKL